MISAFGVEHVSKAFGRGTGKAAVKAEQLAVKFKPIKAGVKPTGPGSLRGRLSQTAWESQSAATKRGTS